MVRNVFPRQMVAVATCLALLWVPCALADAAGGVRSARPSLRSTLGMRVDEGPPVTDMQLFGGSQQVLDCTIGIRVPHGTNNYTFRNLGPNIVKLYVCGHCPVADAAARFNVHPVLELLRDNADSNVASCFASFP